MKTMAYYIKGKSLDSSGLLYQETITLPLLHILVNFSSYGLIIVYILLVQSFCVVFSNAPNSKLMDRVEILEKAILKENPCLNCTLEVRIEYLELFVKKFLTMDLVDQSVN